MNRISPTTLRQAPGEAGVPERTRRKRTIGYREIAAILMGEIRQGRWVVNDLLPTEKELVERFTVGRNTVREALGELRDLGYLKRRRGARSVLTAVDPENGFVNSVSSVEQLLEYAKAARATVLATEHIRLDDALARRLDTKAGSEWVRVGILRSREPNGPPFCYSEVYIDPKYADVVARLESENELYALIEKHHGVVIRRVVQEIEAVLTDANIASRLSVPVGTALLLVRTKFHSSDGRLVEVGLAHFPAGRYKVRIALDRRAG